MMKWLEVFAAGLLVGFSTLGADKLWAQMHETGIIDDTQYQHVLENGSLPGGSVITNSPVPVAEQAGWNRLNEYNVITPAELAAVLFNGSIPNMTAEESQAFADLAPVEQFQFVHLVGTH